MSVSRVLVAALAASLGLAFPARSENWMPFFMGPDDVEVYVDRDAVHRTGDHVQVSAELWFGAGFCGDSRPRTGTPAWSK